MREAQTVAALPHDNIVCIYDCGENRGHKDLAMEFVEGGQFVPLENSDPADRVRVEHLWFPSSPDLVTRHFRGVAGCRPQPCSSAHGGSRPPSSVDHSAAIGQASETDFIRPVAMGDTVRMLAGLAIDAGDRPTGNGHRMAPEGISSVLDVEVTPGTSRPSGRFGRNTPIDPHDEPRQSSLGRTADPWGTPQTGNRCR